MCALWLLGILLYTTSVGNLGQVFGGKFIVGISLGQISVIAPTYIAVSALLYDWKLDLWYHRLIAI